MGDDRRRYDPRHPYGSPTPATPRFVKGKAMAAFNADEFQALIDTSGLEFRWSRAVECPCRMVGSDQWKPDCLLCGGDGWWYIHPDARERRDEAANQDWMLIKAVHAPQGANLAWDDYQSFGGLDSGRATLTVHAVSRVGYRDKFVSVEQVMSRSELLVMGSRGGGNTNAFTVPVGKTGRETAVQRTALRYEPLRISFAAINDGVEATIYREGADYVVREPTATNPARLVWKAGRGPTEGTVYTLHYDCHPVWVVDGAPYSVQGGKGPDTGAKGTWNAQTLPTTFEVLLDFLTPQRGS